MRKSNREITSKSELADILERCDVCRLGLSDQGQPYIVPMNYGYDWDGDQLLLYFHAAIEGRKLDIIRVNNRACFEMDDRHDLIHSDLACGWSMNYESLMGEGIVRILTDDQARQHALKRIMHHYSGRSDWSFDEKALAITSVLQLSVHQVSGKRLAKSLQKRPVQSTV